jgi:nucleotide-binding universal stress UspA family protein
MEIVMLPFRKILCPTDLSESFLTALRAARQMASHSSAEIVVLHVVDKLPVSPSQKTELSTPGSEARPGQIPFNVTKRLEDLMKDAKDSMEEMVRESTTEQGTVHLEVREGYAPVEILNAAHEMGADLIVIAARGGGGPERHRAGSVTQQVVRAASAWVLTVR